MEAGRGEGGGRLQSTVATVGDVRWKRPRECVAYEGGRRNRVDDGLGNAAAPGLGR